MGCKTDLAVVQTAVRAYHDKHGTYPPNLEPALTTPPRDFFIRPSPALPVTR